MASDSDRFLVCCVIMHKSVVLRNRALLFYHGRVEMLTLESPEPALQTLVLPTKLAPDVD